MALEWWSHEFTVLRSLWGPAKLAYGGLARLTRDPITHQGHRSPRWEGQGERPHCSGTKDNKLAVATAASRRHNNKLPADQEQSFYKAFPELLHNLFF